MRRRAWDAAQRVDPSRLVLPRQPEVGAVAIACVYRGRNAAVVQALLAAVPSASVRLWSLDGVVPDPLRDATVGTGPGSRLALLDRLAADVPPHERNHGLVLADDDVRLVVGDLAQLLAVGRRAGFDLYQPAHVATSHASWAFNRRRALVAWRQVDYVEQGPLVVLSASAQRALLPLPDDLDMGWGVEVRWWQAARAAGLRLGIVDAVAMRHLTAAGGAYDRLAQESVLATEVTAGGLADITELHREHGRTLVWRAMSARQR